MKAKTIHPFHHFIIVVPFIASLIVAACASSAGNKPQATPTASAPAFAAKLQPVLQSEMQQYRIPSAVVYVDIPGQGTWLQSMGTSKLAILIGKQLEY